MKFSTRATYGLRALLYLASAYKERAVSTAQIAREAQIPASYLEQILHRLKKRLWVKSLRGPMGGYVLAKNPSAIKMQDVLKDLEGEQTITGYSGTPKTSRSRLASLGSNIFWKSLKESTDKFLESITLQQLIDEARQLEKSKSRQSDFRI